MFIPQKNDIRFLHGELQIVMARIQFFTKILGFVDVGYNRQRVIHLLLKENGISDDRGTNNITREY